MLKQANGFIVFSMSINAIIGGQLDAFMGSCEATYVIHGECFFFTTAVVCNNVKTIFCSI